MIPKTHKRKVENTIKRSYPPIMPTNEMQEASVLDKRLAVLTAMIAERILDFAKDTKETRGILRMSDSRKENPSLSNFTTQGIFLEYTYGLPTTLWTPWGNWRFARNCTDGLPYLIELSDLGLEGDIYIPEADVSMGTIGPIYGLKKAGKSPLPQPLERRDDGQRTDAYESAWQSFLNGYLRNPEKTRNDLGLEKWW